MKFLITYKLRFRALLILSFLIASAPAVMAYEVAGFNVKPRASVTGRYDDNITYAPTNEIDDFITEVSAGLEAKLEGKTRTLTLTGNVSHEIFLDRGEFDNTSGDFTADYKQEIGEYDRFRLRDVFLHSDEPRTFEEAFNRTPGRYSFFRNKFFFDYQHDYTEQMSLTGRYANEMTGFSDNVGRDSMLNSAGAELAYSISSMTRLLFAYDFEIRDFDGGNDAYTNTLSFGLRHYFTKQIFFEGRIGADFIETYNGDSLTKPLFRARLTDDINETTSVDIAFEKESTPNSYTEDIFDYWQISTSLRKQLSERMNAAFSAFYGEGEYVASTREDELLGGYASLSYDFNKNLRGTLKYTYTNVDSNASSQQYTRNTVVAGLSLYF